MVKKGKAHEEVQADGGPLAGQPTLAESLGAAEAAAVVDGDNPSGAPKEITGLEAGAAGADIGDHGAAMGGDAHADGGNGAADAEGEAGRPETVAPETAQAAVFEGVSDGEDALLELEAGQGDAEGSGAGTGHPAQNDRDDIGEGAGGDAGGDGASGADASGAMASMLDDDAGDDPDAIVLAARNAAIEALRYVDQFWMLSDAVKARLHVLFGDYSTAPPAVAAFVRKVGPERAVLDVVASQLKILGFIDDVDLHPAERLALTVFIGTLSAIDTYEVAELAIAEAAVAAERRTVPARLPVDETTLEPVDGPMETW